MVPSTNNTGRWHGGYGRRRRRRRECSHGHSAWNLLRRFDLCQPETVNNFSECLQDHYFRSTKQKGYVPLGVEMVNVGQTTEDGQPILRPVEDLLSGERCTFCGYFFLSCADREMHCGHCSMESFLNGIVCKVASMEQQRRRQSPTRDMDSLLAAAGLVACKTEICRRPDCHPIECKCHWNLTERTPNPLAVDLLSHMTSAAAGNGHYSRKRKAVAESEGPDDMARAIAAFVEQETPSLPKEHDEADRDFLKWVRKARDKMHAQQDNHSANAPCQNADNDRAFFLLPTRGRGGRARRKATTAGIRPPRSRARCRVMR